MKTDFTFTLDTSGDLPRLAVTAGCGKEKIPDYRSYSGAARRALQEFSLLLEKQSRFFSWDIDIEDDEYSLYDPGGRMIAIAASSGLLRGSSGNALIPEADTWQVMVSVNPAENGAFTLKPALPDSSVGENESTCEARGGLKAVAPDYVLADGRLFHCEDLGAHWKELDTIGKRVGFQELPLVTCRGQSLECKVFLERIGDPIGEDRFRISEASFIRDCTSPEDIERRIGEFHRLIAKDPAEHWEELFSRIRERARLFEQEEDCVMIQLPEDRELRRLFLEEKKLASLVLRAEGGRIVVKRKNYKKLRKALEAYGVLKG